VTIGNDVRSAQNITPSGLNHHNYEDVSLPIHGQGVSLRNSNIVEDDCWIGANVTAVAGVTIGKHSIVAAGSIATFLPIRWLGNPARVIKTHNPEN
jgi:acetyltransferase-like isoleucine patch superfamily enzyme